MTTGVLQALPPRNKSKQLDGSLPVKILCPRPSPYHRGRTTWWTRDVELPQQILRASSMEVEHAPP
jgi:hypothetical protein